MSRVAKHQKPPEKYCEGWLSTLDQRTSIAASMRERFKALTDDLGGADSLSYAQRSLCERALWCEFWIAEQERQLAQGGEFDAGRWTQASNTLLGLYRALGLERKARQVPNLNDYLANREGAA